MRRAASIPFLKLPPWDHPEWGRHLPERCEPDSEFDCLYYNKMAELLDRKWAAVVLAKAAANAPRPEPLKIHYCHMWQPDDDRTWGAVPMLLVEVGGMGASGVWARIREGIEATRTMVADFDGFSYISPWYEWELADYWEGGFYDL